MSVVFLEVSRRIQKGGGVAAEMPRRTVPMALYLKSSKATRDGAVSPTPHHAVHSTEEVQEHFEEADLVQQGWWGFTERLSLDYHIETLFRYHTLVISGV